MQKFLSCFKLRIYCCIELKTGSFQASYLGQLGLYVTAV
ncbi:DUF1016 domain-containing protein, partial [bacterium]|nr:DUF1016 domain-containing protein [bacterium]